jgi:hypothetical protein
VGKHAKPYYGEENGYEARFIVDDRGTHTNIRKIPDYVPRHAKLEPLPGFYEDLNDILEVK